MRAATVLVMLLALHTFAGGLGAQTTTYTYTGSPYDVAACVIYWGVGTPSWGGPNPCVSGRITASAKLPISNNFTGSVAVNLSGPGSAPVCEVEQANSAVSSVDCSRVAIAVTDTATGITVDLSSSCPFGASFNLVSGSVVSWNVGSPCPNTGIVIGTGSTAVTITDLGRPLTLYDAAQVDSVSGMNVGYATAPGTWYVARGLELSTDGMTVYDTANKVTWLADANLASSNRFGLPFCTSGVHPCINANGSMSYAAAAAWVSAMNAANYLGHSNWQLPTTPLVDLGCTSKGPNGNSFGYRCSASALGSLYYNGLALAAPDAAVAIPGSGAGPFSNVQPYLYWSQTNAGGSDGNSAFSFDTGWVGAYTPTHAMYVFPMIQGKLPGTPEAAGQKLQVNPGGQTVYDPVTNVTWLANANLGASNSFGLPICQGPLTPAICVASDGAMSLDSAEQFVANMNADNGTGYLGQNNWEIPPVDPSCSGFNCDSDLNPMGELFYKQLALSAGLSAVTTPNIEVGPFHNIQPYLYWTCQAASIQAGCQAEGPVANQEWSFSFGNGFEDTDVLGDELYATAYFAGAVQTSQTINFAAISNRPLGTAPFAIGATTTSGLPVNFAAVSEGFGRGVVCVVSKNQVTLVAVGTCTLQATQAGNSTYAAASPVSQSFQVTQGSQTVAFGSLAGRSLTSPAFLVSATASSGLPVSFTSTTKGVCSVSRSTRGGRQSVAFVTLLAAGECTLQASQAGNADYSAASPVDQSFQVTH